MVLAGRYSRFNDLEDVAVPYSIEVQNKKEGQLVTIEYKHMSANKKDVSIDFNLPGDATVIKW